jgi:hypothetical protein
MIKPSVGRIVWWRQLDGVHDEQPFAAMVTYVHSDRLVNLVVFDHFGIARPKASVQLVQEGDAQPAVGGYAEWMPYQIGQAKKHEPAETAGA